MREIILYGPMRSQFGRSFSLDVKSPGEAFRALSCVVPGFRKWFNERARKGSAYKILVGKRGIDSNELALESSTNDPIRIVPVVTGSKNSKLLGAVVTIVGAAIMYFTANPYVFQVGVGMMIGGVALLLSPTPKAPSPNETDKLAPSKVFDGPVNTANPGNPKPILYGTLEIGSIITSAGIYTEDISPVINSNSSYYPIGPSVGPPPDPFEDFSRWNP